MSPKHESVIIEQPYELFDSFRERKTRDQRVNRLRSPFIKLRSILRAISVKINGRSQGR